MKLLKFTLRKAIIKPLAKFFNSTKSSTFEQNDQNKSVEDFIFSKGILDLKVPAFKFYSSQIHILREPSEFYLSLIVMNI